jgi:membrane dipeptidase
MTYTAADAARLLEGFPLIDGHNDLPYTLRERVRYDLDRLDISQPQPTLQTDIPRLREGRVGGQFWSVYVPSGQPPHVAVTQTLEQIDAVHRMVERYPADLALALTADDVEASFDTGRIACLLGAEGGHSIEESLGVLRMLQRLGVRYLTLTHWHSTPWAGSATDVPVPGGLTAFGEDVVRELNRLGMLVDLAHVAPDTMRAALRVSTAPVVFSHSGCRALVDHPRNVPDDVLRSLAGNRGVLMVAFMPQFVSVECAAWAARKDPAERARLEAAGSRLVADLPAESSYADPPRATVAQVADHVEHARDVAGIDCVGIGADFCDDPDPMPSGLEDVSGYPALFAELMNRGWKDAELRKLAGGNVLRVLREAEEIAAQTA